MCMRVCVRTFARNRFISWLNVKYVVERWSLYYYFFEMENTWRHNRKNCHLRQELLKNLILTFRDGASDLSVCHHICASELQFNFRLNKILSRIFHNSYLSTTRNVFSTTHPLINVPVNVNELRVFPWPFYATVTPNSLRTAKPSLRYILLVAEHSWTAVTSQNRITVLHFTTQYEVQQY